MKNKHIQIRISEDELARLREAMGIAYEENLSAWVRKTMLRYADRLLGERN